MSAEMMRMVTGWEMDAEEIRRVARRVVVAKKEFNVRAGWTAAEDTLPSRMLSQPLGDDAQASLSRETLQAAISAYNELRGWDASGFPPQQQLMELEIPVQADRGE